MFHPFSRIAARAHLRTSLAALAIAAAVVAVLPSPAHAVIIRGRLTDALGKPVAGGQIKLIQSGRVEAFVFSEPDGTFELRSSASGRFTLLGTGAGFLPSIGSEFYGGTTELLQHDVVLSATTIRQEVSVTATGLPTPVPQISAPLTIVDAGQLTTRTNITEELREQPGIMVAQTGQGIGQTSLFVRGGQSDSNKVLIDGVSANDVGGGFDFGPLDKTGISSFETYRGPNSVLYGTDAQSAVVSINTPRGSGLVPVLTYMGDAGNLHQVRNEVTGGGAFKKLDYFAAFSRYNTSNALANDRSHVATSVANLGYELFPRLNLRGTVRHTAAAQGLPGEYDFYGLTVLGKQSDHDLYAQGTVEYTTSNDWHNLARYGIARKGLTSLYFGNVGTPVVFFPGTPYTYTSYFGNTVTIRGANGYSATGRASLFNSDNFLTSNRDELVYQTDKRFSRHFAALGEFRYTNERGASVIPAYATTRYTQRTNFEYTLQLQGDASNRFFYSLGGGIQKNHLFGIAGTPRIGLTYFPGVGRFRGTKLRANFAKGVSEPSLSDEFTSLFGQLTAAQRAQYRVSPLTAKRSRTYDIGLDQSLIRNDKLVVKLGYFHNMFDHQIDYIDPGTLSQITGQPLTALPNFYGAEANTLAYSAQGIEFELDARPLQHWFLRGGYTYLDAQVVQSFSTDAAFGGLATTNPNLPNTPIGSTFPLVGARPFRRAPHTGYAVLNYSRSKLSLSAKTSMVSRSDDSTFLSYLDINGGNTLLLPNRNLDFGYVRFDLGGTYQIRRSIGVYTQLNNLLNNQHMGPIGFPSTPFTFRAGMNFRLGGE